MPRVVIDNREIDVPAGSTLLEAARRLGIDVPTLCWHEGFRANTSCMVCLVRVAERHGATEARRDEGAGRTNERLVPACATLVEEGMCIESETDEIRQARKASLELLLSDHIGECRAPCQYACPFDTDVPRMIRAIAAGRLEEAIVTLRRDMPLAAALVRISPNVCESACRRAALDDSAAIGLLKRYVAEKDLTSERPYTPPCKPASGKRVAIGGTGPAGLSAAYFLLQAGHACTLFDTCEQPGGSLRGIPDELLPSTLVTAEITLIERLGAGFELNATVGKQPLLAELRRDFDAILLAVGRQDDDRASKLGLPISAGRLQVDRTTRETELRGVFAAGDVVRPRGQPIQAAADGKTAAVCINQYLRGEPVVGRQKLLSLRLPQPRGDTLAALADEASSAGRVIPSGGASGGLTDEEARAEAQRCLHCDCRGFHECKLRKYAEEYGADARRFRGKRRENARPTGHPNIVFEPAKCILCGLCVQISEQAGEPLGLTYVGRGFDVGIGVPFDESLAAALTEAGRRCVEVCPTGALAWRTKPGCAAPCGSQAYPNAPDQDQSDSGAPKQ